MRQHDLLDLVVAGSALASPLGELQAGSLNLGGLQIGSGATKHGYKTMSCGFYSGGGINLCVGGNLIHGAKDNQLTLPRQSGS